MLGLLDNIPRLTAWRTIRELQYRSDVRLNADQVHELVLAATGSEEAAQKAHFDFIWNQLKSGQTPEVSNGLRGETR